MLICAAAFSLFVLIKPALLSSSATFLNNISILSLSVIVCSVISWAFCATFCDVWDISDIAVLIWFTLSVLSTVFALTSSIESLSTNEAFFTAPKASLRAPLKFVAESLILRLSVTIVLTSVFTSVFPLENASITLTIFLSGFTINLDTIKASAEKNNIRTPALITIIFKFLFVLVNISLSSVVNTAT